MAAALDAQDTRVEDYLNDKFQTTADLENIDSLLESVKAQHRLLQEQVSDESSSRSFLPRWLIHVC